MLQFLDREEDSSGQDALVFALGAAGGFALGMLLSGRMRAAGGQVGGRVREWGGQVGQKARGVASRLRPTRLRRMPAEMGELTGLEDAVIEAFLGDEVLGGRGIDVGAISRGIIELSGLVGTQEEAELAVRLARRVPGVDTVVNRIEVDDGHRRRGSPRDYGDAGDVTRMAEWQGRRSGMGRRRQGPQTEPDRSDDSHRFREKALEQADRAQYETEGWAAYPRTGERPEPRDPSREVSYREDELDNQDPYDKHAPVNLETQPQRLNTLSRVGEGPKPGTELRLEAADVPVKPHGDVPRDDRIAADPS